jgi:ribosome-binding factor A
MGQGSRPDRVADQIRAELGTLLARELHDPGIGFVTIIRVHISPDLQSARVFYTALGDEKTRGKSARALERAAPFLRRQIGTRLRLKRTPDLKFIYDESIAGQGRIEQILTELHETGRTGAPADAAEAEADEDRATDTSGRRGDE